MADERFSWEDYNCIDDTDSLEQLTKKYVEDVLLLVQNWNCEVATRTMVNLKEWKEKNEYED